MDKFIDMTGWVMREHGVPDSRLAVICRAENRKNGTVRWQCQCSCGSTVVADGTKLRSGKIKSCGCYSKERKFKHGETCVNSRLYRIWNNMKRRCYCETTPCYKNYGARGICVCDEWRENFVAFKCWALANGYTDDLTIEREDGDGNYEPSNCHWATMKEQENNTRHNRFIEYGGETKTIQQWAEHLGIKRPTLQARLDKGWSIERAFTEPVKQRNA